MTAIHRTSPLRIVAVAITIALGAVLIPATSAGAEAGIKWQQDVGCYGANIVNLHYGYAGPKVGNTNHYTVNLYSRCPNYHEFLSVHHTKYNRGSSTCFYGWDNIHNWTLYDFCVPWGWMVAGSLVAAAVAIVAAAIRSGWVPVLALPLAAVAG